MLRYNKDKTTKLFYMAGYIMLVVLSAICLLPFWLIISGSFTKEDTILQNGYSILPTDFSLSAYKIIFVDPTIIIDAYKVSVTITIAGTLFGLFFISMTGYALARKDLKYRNGISFFIYFVTLFNGGLIPWYILMTQYLKLTDNYLALILPGMIGPFNVILMRSFLKSIPEEITESAKIDGAGDFRIYRSLILPLARPGLATIGLFLALGYWNEWLTASLYINTPSKFPLQFYLYNIIQSAQFLRDMASRTSITFTLPSESLKMATAIVATGPIIFLYPFVQKYFVKGLTVGSVKG